MLRTAPVIASTRVLTSRSRSRWPRTPRGLLDGRDALAGALGAAGDRVDQTAGLGLDLATRAAIWRLRPAIPPRACVPPRRRPRTRGPARRRGRPRSRRSARAGSSAPRCPRSCPRSANLVRALRQRADRGADLARRRPARRWPRSRCQTARTPSSARSRAFWAASRSPALAALSVAIRDASLTAARVDSTIRT